MAEELVVKEQLSEAMLAAGSELTRRLDNTAWPLTASLWLYAPATNQWRLLLASPSVEREGPKKAYQHVQKVLKEWPTDISKVDLQNITVTDESHPVVSLLRAEMPVGENTSGIRLSQDTVSGHVIDDAYIYRV